MSDRIYVTYSQPATSGALGIPLYHAQSHYETTDQTGNVIGHQTLDFGPTHFLGAGDAAGAIFEDMFKNDGRLNQFGLISAGVNANATLAKPVDPYEVIADGNDLSSNWTRMLQFKDSVIFDGYAYKPLSQNSNTSASAALVAGGFHPAFGLATDPGNGELLWYSAPGLSDKLQPPIGHAPVWMPLDGILYHSEANANGTTTFFPDAA